MPRARLAFSYLVVILIAANASAEETYFQVPLDKLPLTEGQLPGAPTAQRWDMRQPMRPYIALDGSGEAYAVMPAPISPFGMYDISAPPTGVAIGTPQSGEVTGRLFLAKSDGSGMTMVRFKISADAAKADAKQAFFQAKQAHYEQLLREGLPGAAWFRHEAREAAKSSGRELSPVNQPSGQQGQTDSFDQTFSLFSGGRALSENLQLDRVLPTTRPSPKDAPDIELKSIDGITVQPMDWKALIRDLKPQLDPLAALVPADQHAVFFSSFHSMVSLMDETDRFGTPVLQSIEPRSQDAQTRQRYERQLGVSLTDLGRLLGAQLIGQVVLTGSDPYLRTGTDVAILFEPRNATLLRAGLMAQIGQARQRNPESQVREGEAAGISYNGAASPDRTLSTYVAQIGEAIVLTNSLPQLGRIAAAQKGQAPSLAAQPEYIYFRDRYRRGQGDETALLVLSDATIRRWCGPRWRIADSRRTRAAAALAEIQASHLASLVASDEKLGPIPSPAQEPDLGQTRLTRQGVTSSIYGSLAMMTPIVELPMDRVSQEEADAYKRWRDAYQQNWRWSFDPIAVQLSIHDTKVAADVTVMPLIWATDYRDLVEITRGVKIAPDAGDPHDALVHLVVSINQHARMVQAGTTFASNLAPGLKADPLGWLGQTVSLYIDDDPFWDELAKAGNSDEFMEKNVARLPVAIRADVSNGLKLTAFLVAVRGFIEQTAPEMTVWENLEHEGQPYVKITPSAKGRGQQAGLENVAIYYAATGDSLLITLNEALLWRALDRETARTAAAHDGKTVAPTTRPWLGESIALRGRARALDLLMGGTREAYQAYMQSLAWNNLPILNEWKRRYPDQDPQALHERLWQERLLDPAGGRDVWNDKWQTMESTVYGHPGEPKPGPLRPSALNGLSSASLGVTFEEQGLRGRVQIERAPAPSAGGGSGEAAGARSGNE